MIFYFWRSYYKVRLIAFGSTEVFFTTATPPEWTIRPIFKPLYEYLRTSFSSHVFYWIVRFSTKSSFLVTETRKSKKYISIRFIEHTLSLNVRLTFGRFLCRHRTSNVVKLVWNGNEIVPTSILSQLPTQSFIFWSFLQVNDTGAESTKLSSSQAIACVIIPQGHSTTFFL